MSNKRVLSIRKFELVWLVKRGGWYEAHLYNPIGGYSTFKRFLGYTKKEVLGSLRKDGVICPHCAY